MAIVFAIVQPRFAIADTFQDATWAYEAGDYTTAIRLWRPLAQAGDDRAQLVLGIMYEDGQGLDKDLLQAHKWLNLSGAHGNGEARRLRDRLSKLLDQTQIATAQALAQDWMARFGRAVTAATEADRIAATAGDAGAQYSLGLKYDDGDGLAQDFTAARKWYRQAADQVHGQAQRNLGVMYDTGRDAKVDGAKAAHWYALAALQGDGIAQQNLGTLYQEGHGLPRDMVRAHMWLNLSGAHENKAAHRLRDALAETLSKQQIAEAQALARTWMAQHGQAVALDEAEAVKWIRRTARNEDGHALFTLGMMYEIGHDVPQDRPVAVLWFLKAAARGHVGAQYNLGAMYFLGYGVAQDYVEAHKWFSVANVTGLKKAIVNRVIVAKKMTPEQITEAQGRARDWMDQNPKRQPK